jgi:hypothetical protein
VGSAIKDLKRAPAMAVAEEADEQVGERGTHPPNLSRTSENAVHAKFP